MLILGSEIHKGCFLSAFPLLTFKDAVRLEQGDLDHTLHAVDADLLTELQFEIDFNGLTCDSTTKYTQSQCLTFPALSAI